MLDEHCEEIPSANKEPTLRLPSLTHVVCGGTARAYLAGGESA